EEVGRKFFLQQQCDEIFAHDSAASPIRKHVAQRRHDVRDLVAVVETGVCAGTKDTCNARFILQKASRRAKDIARYFDGEACGDDRRKRIAHLRGLYRCATSCTIEEYFLNVADPGTNFLLDNGGNVVFRKKVGIEALRNYRGKTVPAFVNQSPL